MRFLRPALLLGLGFVLATTSRAVADTKVVLKGVHLCCPACVNAAKAISKEVNCQIVPDRKEKTVAISGADDKAVQKALDALSYAGFYGQTGNKDVELKNDSGAQPGKVESLTVNGAHNCCGACCNVIKQTVKKVSGVTGDTAKPRAKSFKVTGDFDAADLVKALNKAGFSVKVEK